MESTVNSTAALKAEKTPFPTINFDLDQADHRPGLDSQKGLAAPTESSPSAIEKMPHLSRQVVDLWKTRELNTLIHEMLLDSRDGHRKGFPRDVANELMFLGKLNLILRAQEAASTLGVSLGEACHLIEKGDRAALGNTQPTSDEWGYQTRRRDSDHHPRGDKQSVKVITAVRKRPPQPFIRKEPGLTTVISPVLKDTPPMPSSVCLELSTSKGIRHGIADHQGRASKIMDHGFYRCLAKELGGLNIQQIVLSDLGHEHCPWMPLAVNFAKRHCNFQNVVLRADPLSARESLLNLAMASGLDHLLIDFNLASGQWRTKAESLLASDPDYLGNQLKHLLIKRDVLASRTGHRCAISLVQVNHNSQFHLSKIVSALSEEPGLEPYRHVSEDWRHAETGSCHCLAPFIEAQIRTNGHLVACAQDHSGFSFTADLKSINFADAWHGQVFRNIRQRTMCGERPGRLCEICPHRITSDRSANSASNTA